GAANQPLGAEVQGGEADGEEEDLDAHGAARYGGGPARREGRRPRPSVAARRRRRYPSRTPAEPAPIPLLPVSAMPKQDDTPLMQQWREAKSRHPDAILFFRVGDFYEMFYEDAEEGARLLGLTLTARNNGGASDVPLAGVPARARDEYVQRLLRLGRRVAICEQVEDPAEAKGIVRREVVETVTPGVVLADALLSERRNNYVAALCRAPQGEGEGGGGGVPGLGLDEAPAHALAVARISTGELVAAHVPRGALDAAPARF